MHVIHGGTLTGVRYRDEIFDPYVHLYAGVFVSNFILLDDDAEPRRAALEDYLEGHDLKEM